MPTTGLDEHETADLARRIRDDGLKPTAAWLQLNETTVLRAAVGLPLHTSTRAMIQSKLKEAHGKQA